MVTRRCDFEVAHCTLICGEQRLQSTDMPDDELQAWVSRRCIGQCRTRHRRGRRKWFARPVRISMS